MAKFDFGSGQGLLEVDVDASLDIWTALGRRSLLRSALLAALLLELRFAATLSTHELVENVREVEAGTLTSPYEWITASAVPPSTAES
jgi:hypothetical protein